MLTSIHKLLHKNLKYFLKHSYTDSRQSVTCTPAFTPTIIIYLWQTSLPVTEKWCSSPWVWTPSRRGSYHHNNDDNNNIGYAIKYKKNVGQECHAHVQTGARHWPTARHHPARSRWVVLVNLLWSLRQSSHRGGLSVGLQKALHKWYFSYSRGNFWRRRKRWPSWRGVKLTASM